ncbi:phytase, partial [bacterium]|nr:phytase [bacterium]
MAQIIGRTSLVSLLLLLTPFASALGQSKNIWISAQDLALRPITGEAWNQLLKAADSVDTLAVEGGHNSVHDTYTMAAALVAARLNDPARKQIVANNILKAVNLQVENDGNSLSLSRTLPGYVIAADLIDFKSFDPVGETLFRNWLEHVVYVLQLDEATQVQKHEIRGNNQGTQAGVARIVSAIYLDKQNDLIQAAQVFKGWLGDTTAYAGFSWGDLCWQTDPAHPVGILPQGSTMFVAGAIRNVDGVQPDDQRRAGCPDTEPTWPPRTDVHVWGGLSGAVGQAYLLSRAGFDTWSWQDQAILRAVSWQHDSARGNAPAEDDDLWTLPLIDLFYGTSFWNGFPTKDGKQVGWTDWTHGGEKATQFTLQAEVIGQGTVELVPPGPSFVPGTQVQVTAVPSAGWVFIGWNEDLEGLESTQTVIMDEVKEVEAIFGEAASTVLVDPKVSTTPAPDDPNDIAIWIHPTNPERSVLIGVDKDKGIFVWDVNGNELQSIPQDTTANTIDLRQGVSFGGQLADLAVANLRDAGKLAVFKVNPDYTGSDVLTQIADVNSASNNVQVDSYGLSLYKRLSDGALFVFERPKRDGILRQYRIQDDGSGSSVIVTPVRDLNYAGGKAEGFVTDDELGFLYVAEEGEGVHKFLADPNSSPDPLALFAIDDGITPTRQGMGLYACNDGTGYLVLSSKGNSTFKVYEREGDNLFVKTVVPKGELGNLDLNTEGLTATSSAAGPNFPAGLVAAHDATSNKFHVYDWRDIAESDLNVCADGELTARPDISVTPTMHNFGVQAVNSTTAQTFALRNDGIADLAVSSISLIDNAEDEFFILTGDGAVVLGPGASHEVIVSFNPVSIGDTQATLRIISNDPNESPWDVVVTGSGYVPRPQIIVSPTSQDYGIVTIGRTELRSFTISNTGTADLTVTSLTIAGAHAGEFSVENGLVPFTISQMDTRIVDVRFSPITEGVKDAVLRFESNDLDDSLFDISLIAMASLQEPETVIILPTDDAYIRSTRATNNYGNKNALYVRQATGIFIGYLKFSISDLISPVTNAKIRVYVLDDGPDGGGVYQVSNNYEGTTTPWAEADLTWANAPVIQGDPLDAVGTAVLNSWVEFDVSAAITGNGTYSFAIRNANSEDIKYSSKEWTHPPELVVETAGGINPATQLLKISGDNQDSTIGSPLADPL